jgi:hypothetical protein
MLTVHYVLYHEDLPKGSLAQTSDYLEICNRFGLWELMGVAHALLSFVVGLFFIQDISVLSS